MTIESGAGFALALLVWVLIPGPAILAIVGRSLTSGFRSAVHLIVGILLGDLFYISIVLFGMAAIGRVLGDFFFIVRMIGACYLVILGLRLWFRNPALINDRAKSGAPDRYKSLIAGFSITLGNPKAILFHMGFLPTFFDLSTITVPDAFLIVLIFLAVLGSSLTLYAYMAGRAGMFFNSRKKVRALNLGAGTILIGAGVAVAAKN